MRNNTLTADIDVKELPKVFDSTGETLHSGRNTVKLLTVGGKVVVVKKYKKPNFIQCISYSFFKKSKAKRAYLYSFELQKRGFNTPTGIAYVEIKKCLLLRESYFVSDYCALPSVMPLLKREDFDCVLADALAKFLVSLHEKGVLHGDLNLSNILYEKDAEGEYSFWLIDTNRSKFKRQVEGDGARRKLSADVSEEKLRQGDVNEVSGSEQSGVSRFEQATRRECIENMKRLTHERALMEYIVSRYAMLRGWDVDETVSAVMRSLQRFEERNAKKKRVKRVFK